MRTQQVVPKVKFHRWQFPLVSCRVYDADTLMEMKLDLGFGITFETTGRLYGINAPEVRGKEKQKGVVARDWLDAKISTAHEVLIQTRSPYRRRSRGKFGRWLIVVVADGIDLNEQLVNEGHATWAQY